MDARDFRVEISATQLLCKGKTVSENNKLKLDQFVHKYSYLPSCPAWFIEFIDYPG